jgi:hypothetical protein
VKDLNVFDVSSLEMSAADGRLFARVRLASVVGLLLAVLTAASIMR